MKLFYKIFLLAVLVSMACLLPMYNPVGNIVFFRLVILIFILAESTMLFKEIVVDNGKNNLIKNITTMFFSFFVLFLFLEAVFMFVPRSDGVGETYAQRLFYHKYWQPINSLGFRDREPEADKDSAVLFVGDSFAEGWGLKFVKDRYSDIVRQQIAGSYPRYCFTNIGVSGIQPKKEFSTMTKFLDKTGKKPVKIYLQYFGNDIFDIADSMKPYRGYSPWDNLPKALKPVVKSSYLLNYIYWLIPQKGMNEFNEYLIDAYKDTACFRLHTLELNTFVNFAKIHNAELTVIVFPFLTNTELSKTTYTDKVIQFFNANNIKTIDVSKLVTDIPLRERIVNSNDQHASVKVNRAVANEILKQIKK